MEDILRQLIGYARGMWLYRWWGLLAAWVIGIAAAVGIYVLPDRYESSARIYVDTQSVLKPLMAGLAVQPNVDQQVTILSRTLISRPNIEKLIRMADLDLTIKDDRDREALIDQMTRKLSIGSAGRDNLFTLAYQDEQPERAKRVVQSFVSIFVEAGLGDKRKDADSARRFIEEQIKAYEQKLEEGEARLKEFKLKNLERFGGNKPDYVGQMAAIREQVNQARLELREAENSRDALKRQLEGGDASMMPAPDMSMMAVPELDGRIASLRSSLDTLLQRYTEAHPDVVGARKMLRQLEDQRKKELEARRAEALANPGVRSPNPMYQQSQLAIASAEGAVASLRARVAEYESRYRDLEKASQLVPQIEAEFTQLNRDYEVNKSNYNQLLSRRESASMSVEMDSSAGMADFRLIDPPSTPQKPAAPNRTLLMPLAGIVALAAGLVIAFLLSQFRPTFQEGRALREVTGLPLLGAVSFVPDEGTRRRARRGHLFFAGGVAGLAGCFAVMTVLVALLRA